MQNDIKYPIGKFVADTEVDEEKRRRWIDHITVMPSKLEAAVDVLTDEQLDTPYRLGGWTPRQVVHHLADSHMNGYIRLKLALTEDNPTIKVYDQDAWAELADGLTGPIELSLPLVANIHKRWSVALKSLNADQFARTYQHPESGLHTVDTHIQTYAWHGRHHIAHITGLRERMGW